MSKILIVDDDSGFVNATTSVLKGAGFDVASAATAADCISKAESEKPDLILLDVSLSAPEDGLQAAKELFKKGITIPLIILENVAKVATLSVDASEMAVEAYAEKPIDNEKIISKIKAILSR